MRGGRPGCREGALRLLLAAGPAGAERACAAAATRRLERAAAQQRSCGSLKGALRDSRVRGSSSPALFLPRAWLWERRGAAAAETRYCTYTAREEGSVWRRLYLLVPRWGSEKMVLYLLTRSLLRHVKLLFLRYSLG
ncbi:hypothetical protein CIB84_006824 [Bambusicola thoracicus]|uniref:Uncharacterized protein n=1 Tax=Bambusicola thoracicus TaxID=9083 RepID=A0A2P4SZ82_BAMTH|nr:hypothetical protein CIB84_006824 [Bambusicola thoracicus]